MFYFGLSIFPEILCISEKKNVREKRKEKKRRKRKKYLEAML